MAAGHRGLRFPPCHEDGDGLKGTICAGHCRLHSGGVHYAYLHTLEITRRHRGLRVGWN